MRNKKHQAGILKSLLEQISNFQHTTNKVFAYVVLKVLTIYMLTRYILKNANLIFNANSNFKFDTKYEVILAGYFFFLLTMCSHILFLNTRRFLWENYPHMRTNDLEYIAIKLDKAKNIDLNDEAALIALHNSLPLFFNEKLRREEEILKATLLASKPTDPARIQQLPSDIQKMILQRTVGQQNTSLIFTHLSKKNEENTSPSQLGKFISSFYENKCILRKSDKSAGPSSSPE